MPFSHYDRLLDSISIGAVVFSCIDFQDNPADKARKMAIPIAAFGKRANPLPSKTEHFAHKV
ncbi:hypothetical protein MGEO_13405 [Marivita geojedonensis]|uniref:Uncharacterized protein n=1 Tax=Marivita geojedonensis TaxID=1123756 RepID=A0A1X4NJD2_9RHOB|nr:hypothetical protein MGEO_13405 [Marivita geojedonensis]